ncbi:hypothetical protein AWP49_24935 [Escherichia coli]|nr:hypothetical protein AWP49_24935 [Escherichia coli]
MMSHKTDTAPVQEQAGLTFRLETFEWHWHPSDAILFQEGGAVKLRLPQCASEVSCALFDINVAAI